MTPLAPEERLALEDVAADLGTKPKWLWQLISFESGWDPQVKNPGSSARGLIQFMNSTARELGYLDSAGLVRSNPTREKQLRGPVLDYLRRYAPYGTEQSLYMAVFYPAARHWDQEREFPPEVQEANPGIRTVRDYVEHVQRRAGAYEESEGTSGIKED